jgi:hypothetical protein
MNPKPVTSVPARIAGNPNSGWTVYEFKTAEDAAGFVAGYPECAMPCWKRFETIDGALMQVR